MRLLMPNVTYAPATRVRRVDLCHPERSEGSASLCHHERSEGSAPLCHHERSEGSRF